MEWKIYFCKFYEINSSQELFLYCKNFGVDGAPKRNSQQKGFSSETLRRFTRRGSSDSRELSGTGDSQRDSRESIRANRSQLKPLFL